LPILEMDDDAFRIRYRRTAIWRTKRRGLQRNACVVLGNRRDPIAVPALVVVALNAGADPVVRGHAAWALGRIGGTAARDALYRVVRAETLSAARDDSGLVAEATAALTMCE
jgi:epoxyqueuosine reductase